MDGGSTDAATRAEIAALLANGLETEAWPRAGTSEMVSAVIGRLQRAAGEGLESRLVIAGMTDHPPEVEGMEQPCETCMYYLVHRRFCDLPELNLPVEPRWSCRLWRI